MAVFKVESLGPENHTGYSQHSNQDDSCLGVLVAAAFHNIPTENKSSGSAALMTLQAPTAVFDPEHTPKGFLKWSFGSREEPCHPKHHGQKSCCVYVQRDLRKIASVFNLGVLRLWPMPCFDNIARKRCQDPPVEPENSSQVLVHCHAGAHRAGTTAVAYLMHAHGISASAATFGHQVRSSESQLRRSTAVCDQLLFSAPSRKLEKTHKLQSPVDTSKSETSPPPKAPALWRIRGGGRMGPCS